ncbi:alpha/beta hydrolase fold domain-containing protein [Gracilibacillus suaedae]|uniref:alpha/beta hydrolase fold domain-containing protein n=1 Tax=Gracilibacillus suaedae TaxID=2820273 RepID=UPI001ABEE049|nr:alpha/beta hydrolase [Gracilibacillus suaedae]
MSVQIYQKRRSIKSFLFEKFLAYRKTKEHFSSIENTTEFVNQVGRQNVTPYDLGDMVFSSDIQEGFFEGMKYFTLNDQQSTKQRVILYIHGGAWTNQPLKYHWEFMDNMAQALHAKVIAPIYPKVPHFNYKNTYPTLVNLYKKVLETVESPRKLILMGDSAGGNIALGLAHLLKMHHIPQPKDIILLSACVDMVLDNPEIPEFEKKDPMLSRAGMEVITQIWAGDKNLKDPLISPIYGDFKGLGKITQFIGTREGLYPDAMLLKGKLKRQGIDMNTFIYPKMNHVFVIMPIPEAKDAQQKIIDVINS